MIKIGVKFCGNCNPVINVKKIFTDLRNELKDTVELVNWEEDGYRIVLVINGCSVACVQEVILAKQSIIVAGESLDYVFIQEKNLIFEIKRKIEKLIKCMEL